MGGGGQQRLRDIGKKGGGQIRSRGIQFRVEFVECQEFRQFSFYSNSVHITGKTEWGNGGQGKKLERKGERK